MNLTYDELLTIGIALEEKITRKPKYNQPYKVALDKILKMEKKLEARK
jgi:hypothetical protein